MPTQCRRRTRQATSEAAACSAPLFRPTHDPWFRYRSEGLSPFHSRRYLIFFKWNTSRFVELFLVRRPKCVDADRYEHDDEVDRPPALGEGQYLFVGISFHGLSLVFRCVGFVGGEIDQRAQHLQVSNERVGLADHLRIAVEIPDLDFGVTPGESYRVVGIRIHL